MPAKKAARKPAAKPAARRAAKATAKKAAKPKPAPASAAGDWRPATLEHVRRLIREADPHAVEEVKWRKPSNPAGVPVWSHDGILCTGETYKGHLRFTFFHGAALKDPAGLFNANLVGVRRAIHLHEGDRIDEDAFKALVREAVAFNTAG